MYYYTYLVIPTNIKSRLFGKVYFGKHKTENLNDGYIGSGTQILRYLNKHPNDYYREIIKFYSSEEELNKAEFELIHPHLGNKYCLNLREGGEGGAMHPDICKAHSIKMRGRKTSQETKNKISKALEGHKHTLETKNKISKANKGNSACGRPGHTYTPEQIEKYREAKLGEKNPMYGQTPWNKGLKNCFSEETRKKQSDSHKGIRLIWITNDIISKRMTPELAAEYIKKYPEFKYGRIYKK